MRQKPAAGPNAQAQEIGDHYITVAEGRIPANDWVWVCDDCGERRTDVTLFNDFECPPDNSDDDVGT